MNLNFKLCLLNVFYCYTGYPHGRYAPPAGASCPDPYLVDFRREQKLELASRWISGSNAHIVPHHHCSLSLIKRRQYHLRESRYTFRDNSNAGRSGLFAP